MMNNPLLIRWLFIEVLGSRTLAEGALRVPAIIIIPCDSGNNPQVWGSAETAHVPQILRGRAWNQPASLWSAPHDLTSGVFRRLQTPICGPVWAPRCPGMLFAILEEVEHVTLAEKSCNDKSR